MDGLCPECKTQLAPPWKFCPACGTATTPETQQNASLPQAEKTPVRGVFSGILLGVLVAPPLIIFGVLLCLTGLGAFLGVPMIIAGILAPLAGPVIGFGSLKGKCPWCDAPVSCLPSTQSFDCDACHRRVVVRDHKFAPVA